MSVGIRTGIRCGIRTGIRTGIANHALNSGAWPINAAQMLTAAGGLGAWANIWRLEETSSTYSDDVGGVSLTVAGTPTRGVAGAIPGDLAIDLGADGNSNRAAAAAAASIQHALDSFGVYVCQAITATPSVARHTTGKVSSPFWGMQVNASGHWIAVMNDTVTTFTATVAVDHRGGQYDDAIMIVDRAANRLKIISNRGSSAEIDITACLTISNAALFCAAGRHVSTSGPVKNCFTAHTTDVTGMLAGGAAMVASVRAYTGR